MSFDISCLGISMLQTKYIYIYSFKGLPEPTEVSVYQKDLEKIRSPNLGMW